MCAAKHFYATWNVVPPLAGNNPFSGVVVGWKKKEFFLSFFFFFFVLLSRLSASSTGEGIRRDTLVGHAFGKEVRWWFFRLRGFLFQAN